MLPPALLILAAALLFSTGGAAIKGTELGGVQVAGLRSAIAAVVLFALLPPARRALRSRRAVPKAALVGLAYAATMILFVLANKRTTAAHTIFLQSTAPLYLLVLSPWLLRERLRRSELLFLPLLAVGLVLLLFGDQAAQVSAPEPVTGNLLATAAGLSWALTILGLRWLAREAGGDAPGLAAVVLGNLFAALACLPFALPLAASASDLLLVGYLGVFQIGLAYVCLTLGLGRVPAFEAALLLLVEPVLNPIWSYFFQDERPGAAALAGGLLILVATVLRSALQARQRLRRV